MTPIVCKPTSWFYMRAIGMLAMFAFLGGWFFKDAYSGYREENLIYLTHRSLATAIQKHEEMKKDGLLSAESWKQYAATQHVDIGDDASLVPASTTLPIPWPPEFHDSALLAKGQAEVWEAIGSRMQWDRKPPEKLHEAGSIREQWYFAYALSALALYCLFILLRTMRRSMRIDAETITTQEGRTVRLAELTRLDLRKWANKGLAYSYYPQADGKEGRIRIDGLTYGGFQKERGEPAEALMVWLRKNFTGEIIEYAPEESAEEKEEAKPEAAKTAADS
jgi:hypothetical protein